MADTENKTEAQTKAEEAAAAKSKADEAARKAAEDDKSASAKRADKLAAQADDKAAEAADAGRVASSTEGATKARDVKADSAVTEPDRDVGDHHAQKFSNTPENPPLARHLDGNAEIPEADRVKLVLTTSDTIAAGQDAVCYVHRDMVDDYLRAGWRKADAP